jgi:hypothetical protein
MIKDAEGRYQVEAELDRLRGMLNKLKRLPMNYNAHMENLSLMR